MPRLVIILTERALPAIFASFLEPPLIGNLGSKWLFTTSSTEAELLAIADVGKHLFWWICLFDTIHFEPECPIVIHCDNWQTIGLLTKEDAKMMTKLRHININWHWWNCEIWMDTYCKMPADGLTKVCHGLGIEDNNESMFLSKLL